MFFVNWANGVNYNLVAQPPQYDIHSIQDIRNIPLTAKPENADGFSPALPEILSDVASVKRSNEMEAINHYNIRRVVDVYAGVQDRDLGAVDRDIEKIVAKDRKLLPRGSFVTVRGQILTMKSAYAGLLGGLAFSIVLQKPMLFKCGSSNRSSVLATGA